jgi:serine/threonine protein kinase
VLAPGTILVSRYRVLSQIGRGGMGEVYLVEHAHTGDRAALKVLHGAASTDPESIERFKREARAPARIQSENVVRVLDADCAPELGGAPFLVMELLHGSDLQKIVAQRGPLPATEVAFVLGQVARALDKAHSIGIVHRDLKPENLFLHQREDGTSVLKILDFGISKTMDDAMATGLGQLTRTGTVMGTPLYMALEQALGRRDLVGPATDVWALGLIAIFLLTGEPYWEGRTVPDILAKVLSHAMYPPSTRWGLPPAIDGWILRSCARLPEQRFRTAGEQVAELTEILRHASVSAAAHAPTMLRAPSVPPAALTPPHVTPPHVTPAQLPPPYVTPYVPPSIGASTNEPYVQSARSPARPSGMSLGVKVAIALVVLGVMGIAAAGVIVFAVGQLRASSAATVTYAPPNPTETATATAPPESSVIEPLTIGSASAKPHVTAPPTALVATATATSVATATATVATAHTGLTHEQCRASCTARCAGASDMTDCLVPCLKKCP